MNSTKTRVGKSVFRGASFFECRFVRGEEKVGFHVERVFANIFREENW